MSAVDLVGDHTRRQVSASDPRASAWVSANAGSGKTHVLAQRVKRLLLDGVDPGKILCLTFTKAAAANMANRVLGDLAKWVEMTDRELDAELTKLSGSEVVRVSRAERAAARRVFARAIETPGGLKIQTIHAFCDALLHQFPLEAGVAASFEVMDDARTAELAHAARVAVIQAASEDADGLLGRALAVVTGSLAEDGFAALLDGVVKMRGMLDATLPSLDDREALAARLRDTFGLDAGTTREGLEARILSEALLPPTRWRETIELLRSTGNTSDTQRADALAAALALDEETGRAAAYDALFRTDKGEFRKPGGSFVTKAFEKIAPALHDALKADLDRLGRLDETRRALEIVERSLALVTLARAVADRIDRAKAERGLLDFSDLVTRAAALLSSAFAPWVRFKLDRGIDHVLVDEAQDTSPEQWRVIAAIAEEFFAGESARDVRRTLFVVGDEKQSIFSFQGADPREFARMRGLFARRARDAARPFRELPLQLSFRSSAPVLTAVDAVFAREDARAGLTATDEAPLHQSARASGPGVVEIWPIVPRLKAEDVDGWRHPFDHVARDDPKVVLADRIAETIKAWLTSETVMDGTKPRLMRAGDVMILVRRRGPLFDALIRSLKDKNVPVAGADRLKLVEHIAVMDLMALGDVVLLPEDDLVLATLMKSPLIGLDEDDLFALAHGRDGRLFDTLGRRHSENPRWTNAFETLAGWRARADLVRPYEFFAGVLGADGGRTALESRLGREANDALDEFLARALDYERTHTPSLQGFLAWMRETAVDVKREMEQGRDEVRVMTAHNAKGLEAKVVFLPDTTARPGEGHVQRLLCLDANDGTPLIVWSPNKGSDVGPLGAAREGYDRRQSEEHRRLLYVAMTRAEERLIVCGHASGNAKTPSDACWYALVEKGLGDQAVEELDANGDVRARLWQKRPAPPRAQSEILFEEGSPAAPAWVRAPAPPPPPRRPTLTPSRLDRDATPTGGAGEGARRRGALLHRLLQSLPDVPAERRDAVARSLLRRDWPEQADALADEISRVLGLPELTPFLGPDALSEVPVVGPVTLSDGGEVFVSGRIDRLAVTADGIQLLDYKTGAAPAPGEVPEHVVGQLALYAALLGKAYPGRAIHAAVMWTEVPRLDRLTPDRLRAALAQFGPASLAGA
jgi:ATP-dependent helicase/nuclease subunit A